MVVKSLEKTATTWYSTDDDLKGYDYVYTDTERSFPFSKANFTEFWFLREIAVGQYKWLRVVKANVTPATPSVDHQATTISSYQSSHPQTFRWDLAETGIYANP